MGKELSKKYGDSTSVSIVDVENYTAADLLPKEKTVVLCMATYGDGEPTDNAAEFYKWLLKEAEAVDDGDKEPFLTVGPSSLDVECSNVLGSIPCISDRNDFYAGRQLCCVWPGQQAI